MSSSRPEGVPQHLVNKRLQIMGRCEYQAPVGGQGSKPVFPDPRATTRRTWEKALFEIRRQVRDTQRDEEEAARAMCWLRAKAEGKAKAKGKAKPKAKPKWIEKDTGGKEKTDGEAALTKKPS
jgi:hypothetical protein